jgi:hypothetical protein
MSRISQFRVFNGKCCVFLNIKMFISLNYGFFAVSQKLKIIKSDIRSEAVCSNLQSGFGES